MCATLPQHLFHRYLGRGLMEKLWELLTKIMDTRLICCKRYWVHPRAFDEDIEHILELLMGNWIHFEAADENIGYTLELLMRDYLWSCFWVYC
jgi:hypothetical protein